MTTGERVIAFIEAYCRVPEGALVGQNMRLAPFQKEFILAVYDNPAGTRRAYLSIARKNAKTATIACLVLAHLVGPVAVPNSQIVSGARSRDQAALVFHLAEKIVEMSPKLRKIVRIVPSGKRLIGLLRNVEYKAISAEGRTAHGLSPVLAILDEVGQVQGPQDAFVDAITTSQGAHETPLLIAISTQAPTDADLFSVWLDDAEKSQDPRIVSHVYKAEEGADVLDERAWAAANPALGLFRSLDDLREQAIQASRMPSAENTFRNLCLNQRVSTIATFISRNVWLECSDFPEGMEGAQVWGGLDLSSRKDLTAFVAVALRDGKWDVWCRFWAPEEGLIERSKADRVPYDVWAREGYLHLTPGRSVDYAFVAAELADVLSDADVQMIGYDRWRIDLLKKELEAIGVDLPLEPFGQGFKDMSPALDTLEAELLNGRLRHGAHPVLTMCAANAVVRRDEAGNRKLDKARANGRIDGMVALAMALGCQQRTAQEPVATYEVFFV
jgi:phage terminase large subunit-like protein